MMRLPVLVVLVSALLLAGCAPVLSRQASAVGSAVDSNDVAKISLAVAGLAAAAALLNAVAALISTWRESRWLKISVGVQQWGGELVPGNETYQFRLTVLNPAKSANRIYSMRCFIDGIEQSIEVTTTGALDGPIDAFDTIGADFVVKDQERLRQRDFRDLRFAIYPVSGPRRRFRFRPDDLGPRQGGAGRARPS
jgi:hypothetical protein